jgi:hypothetical protein
VRTLAHGLGERKPAEVERVCRRLQLSLRLVLHQRAVHLRFVGRRQSSPPAPRAALRVIPIRGGGGPPRLHPVRSQPRYLCSPPRPLIAPLRAGHHAAAASRRRSCEGGSRRPHPDV